MSKIFHCNILPSYKNQIEHFCHNGFSSNLSLVISAVSFMAHQSYLALRIVLKCPIFKPTCFWSSLYYVHFTLNKSLCTWLSAHYTLHISLSTLHSYSYYYTLHFVFCAVQSVHCTLSIAICALDSAHCTLCILCSANCTLYILLSTIALCKLHAAHCTLYSANCSLNILHSAHFILRIGSI